eukprot:TRINITY_DN12115_c0_g1_i1.p1 TRINITY_DN12115_c0_g1~~TRINITY_DN12115_c0_g1_i1.p1  ORF type:complete len:452 (+),score=31.35 TRINITY_DN12115_c0_g1_i1:20-1375(+)
MNAATENVFEQSVVNDVLVEIFYHLYTLPISKTSFSGVLVNKRWSSHFRHPLQTFFVGDYDYNLGQFPPSYYVTKCKLHTRILGSIGMTRQLSYVSSTENSNHEHFIKKEMLLHDWIVDFDAYGLPNCKNSILQKKIEVVKRLYPTIVFYRRCYYITIIQHLLDEDETFLRLVATSYVVKEFENHWMVNLIKLYLDEKQHDSNLVELAVRANGKTICCIPRTLIDDRLCELAVTQNGLALRYLFDDFCSDRLCKIAVMKDGLALQYVSSDRMKEKLSEVAVAQNGLALEHVYFSCLGPKLCELAVRQNGKAIQFVKPELKSPMLRRAALEQNGKVIKYIYNPTREELIIAVNQNPMSLEFIPEIHQTEELCRIAVKQNPLALEYVSKSLMTDDLRNIALEQPRPRIRPEKEVREGGTKELWTRIIAYNLESQVDCPLFMKNDVISNAFFQV